jgi:hypothetical protein
MAERGLSLARTTIIRWVRHYTPEFEKRGRRYGLQLADRGALTRHTSKSEASGPQPDDAKRLDKGLSLFARCAGPRSTIRKILRVAPISVPTIGLPPEVARYIKMIVAQPLADLKQRPNGDEPDLTSC